MVMTRALLHSYSLLVRDRSQTASGKSRSNNVPRGMFASNPRCGLPKRSQLSNSYVPSGQVAVRGDRVLARCFSLGKAASLFHTAGGLAAEFSDEAASPMAGAIARLALQGMSSGLINVVDAADPFIMDLGAGLMSQVAHHGADRVQRYASDELKESGGALGGREQLVRLAAYCAFVDTPLMHWWQDWLDMVIMPGDPHGPLAVALKVTLDQGLMAPLATALMLMTIKVLEGKGNEALPYLKKKFMDKLLPDYSVWPVARIVQYAFIPQAQHPIFEGLVSVTSAAIQVIASKKQHQGASEASSDIGQHTEQQQEASVSFQPFQKGSCASSGAQRKAHPPSPLSKSSSSELPVAVHAWQGLKALSPFAHTSHLPLDILDSSNHDGHSQGSNGSQEGSHHTQLQLAVS